MDEIYGELLYEYSDAVSPFDMTKSQRKKHLKSFSALCIMLCTLLLTVWCVWNFVLDLGIYSTGRVIKQYIGSFIVLFVVLLITALSVFGLWGKFLRKTKFYRPHEPEARERMQQLQSDLEKYDSRKSKENAVAIYENAIIVTVDGEKKYINRLSRYSVTMIKSGTTIFLGFDGEYTGNFSLKCLIPSSEAHILKKHLGDRLTELNISKSAGKAKRESTERKPKSEIRDGEGGEKVKPTKQKRERKNANVDIEKSSLIVGIITMLIGVVLTVIGGLDLMNGMPPTVGGFPILLGLLFAVLAFNKYEIVNAVILKIAVSALFIYMGICFLLIIEEGVTKAPVTFASLLRHPTAYAVCCLFFAAVGISFIPNSIKSLVEYIRYR